MLFFAVFLFVTVQNLQSATISKEEGMIFKFPDDDYMTDYDSKPAKLQAALTNKFGQYDVHESCKNQTFCTIMPPNYPEAKFNEMFKGYKIPPMPTLDVLGNRQGDPSFTNGCETLVTYEPLYKVRAKRDKDAWRTVVQAPAHEFIQRIRLETCMPSTSSCFTPLLENSPSFETACVQMDTVWELLVESADGKGTEKIEAELPTCCSCKYKELSFLTRFADTSSSNKTKA